MKLELQDVSVAYGDSASLRYQIVGRGKNTDFSLIILSNGQ